MDPAKLKVVELRAELAARGLDQKGVKAVLVSRLQAALEQEQQNLTAVTTDDNYPAQQDEPPSILPDQLISQQQFAVQNEPLALSDTSSQDVEKSPASEHQYEAPIQDEPPIKELQQQQQQQYYQQETEAQLYNQNQGEEDEEGSQSSQSASGSGSGSGSENENESNDDDDNDDNENNYDQNYEMSSAPVEKQPTSAATEESCETDQMETEETENVVAAEQTSEKIVSESDNNHDVDEPMEEIEQKTTEDKLSESNEATAQNDESSKNGDEEEDAEKNSDQEKEQQSADKESDKQDSRKRKRSRSKSKSPPAKRANRRASPARNTDDFTNEEDEPEFDENAVLLSWYDSDLNLAINKPDLCSARPMSEGALALAWAGARSTYGVTHGKVCYEVQVNEINRIQNLSDERNLYELRCGWSILSDNLQLGEAPLSFGYSGCAKKASDSVFSEYGIKYGSRGDVVGVYLDMDSSPCTIQYTVNGEAQGTAFEFNKEDLNGAALYPHILTKNLAFTVNFGQCSKLLVNEERPNRSRRDEGSRRDKSRSHKESTKSSSPTSDDKQKSSEPESQKKNDEKTDSVENDDNDEKEEKDVKEEKEEKDEKDEKDVKEEKEEKEEKLETEEQDEEKTESKEPEEEQVEQEKATVSENGDSNDAKNGDKDKPNESQQQQKEYVLLPGYELIGNVGIEELVQGYQRPKTRKECEVILLIGLPGAGKTHWANQHSKENIDKHYNILGVQNLLSKMTVCGESRKKHHSHGRWERFIDWATRGLHSIQDIAVKKRRNYILDQPNVLASAQRRKMKGYGDFKRIAAVIIPEDATFKERSEKQTEKTVSEHALNELKANFTLPSPDFGWFDEVIFTELDEEEAKKKVEEFNEKGKKALKERERDNDRGNRRRDDNRGGDRYGRGDRRNWGQSSDRRWRHQPNSSQWMHNRGMGSGGGGGGGGGGSGGRSRDKWHGSSGSGGSSNWGNRRYDQYNHRDRRHDDRRGGSRSDRDYKDSRGSDKRGGSDKHGSKRDKDNHSSSRSSYSSKSSSGGSHWNVNKGYDRSQSMSSNSRNYGSSFGSMSSSQQSSSSNNWASATSNYTPQQQQWLQWQQQGPIMTNQHQSQPQQHQQANNSQWWQGQQQQQQTGGNHQGWQQWATYAQAYTSNSNGANMAKK